MVSFQCEVCANVFTKKKLDAHRGQCRGASFTCLDCMVNFQGTTYRSHTSCVSEAKKHQGALYKEQPSKPQRRKSVTIDPSAIRKSKSPSPPHSPIPPSPYVEDASDADDLKKNGAPPPAPSPPPPTSISSSASTPATAAPLTGPVNVFDFLVNGDTPNASKVSLGGTREAMKMVEHAPSVFNAPKELVRLDEDEIGYDVAFEENGFSYGTGPIPRSLYQSNPSVEFITPAPRKDRTSRNLPPSPEHSRNSSLTGTGDKKRKRGQPEELNGLVSSRVEDDIAMTDAPANIVANGSTPPLKHSGLTGGLKGMMKPEGSLTPDYPDYGSDRDENGRRYQDPISPIKRSRRENDISTDHGLGIAIKGRAGRIMSLFGGATAVTTLSGSSNDSISKALVRTRRRSSSEGDGYSGPIIHVRRQRKARVRQSEVGRSHKNRRRGGATTTTTTSHAHSHSHHTHYDYDHNSPSRPSRRLKTIEYHHEKTSHSGSDRSRSPRENKTTNNNVNGKNTDNQLVIYRHSSTKTTDSQDQHDPREKVTSFLREKASHFLSLVTKGPDSDRGFSVHKALKRYHRDYPSSVGSEEREGDRRGRAKGRDRDRRGDDEQDLWRVLRLKKNDRGEVVVFV